MKFYFQPNDSFEFTIKPRRKNYPRMDLFWMYTTSNESWVAGTSGDGTKYKYTYPLHDETCAGDLLGHIFWVPCNPRKVAEYGPHWYLDHPSKNFTWNRSHYNVKRNGKCPRKAVLALTIPVVAIGMPIMPTLT
ncbi:unnamed protein product [Haemonchus placei]|uniref:Glycoprotein n=1 Tax=Haemonchus placei TaxID=6290 RepID=A0A0N4X5N8_HAEPC|nr:unnamed protein product [Haemonchus placei]